MERDYIKYSKTTTTNYLRLIGKVGLIECEKEELIATRIIVRWESHEKNHADGNG